MSLTFSSSVFQNVFFDVLSILAGHPDGLILGHGEPGQPGHAFDGRYIYGHNILQSEFPCPL